MTRSSVVLVCVSVIFVSEISAWTIDLPDVRRFYFERFPKKTENETELSKDQYFYDNINGDSLHNTIRKENTSVADYVTEYEKKHPVHKVQLQESLNNVYADGYNHGDYMLKKISDGIIRDGSPYLDGLRLAIDRYIELTKNCSMASNFTLELPANITLSVRNFTTDAFRQMCARATASSEHVRRLADLVLHAASRLQSVAYAAKYNREAAMEENELLLRLAWYLDKLARLTGYEPAPEPPAAPPTRPTLPTLSFNPLNISEEVKARLLSCLSEQSDQPATVRCALPDAPSLKQQIVTLMSGGTAASLPLQQAVDTSANPRAGAPSLPEILLATDTRGISAPPVRSVKKRSVTDENNPLVKLLNFYTKHKVWEFSFPTSKNDNQLSTFDVSNHIHKRSIPPKYRIPDDPMPDLSKYVKGKPGVRYVKETLDLDKIFMKKLLPPKKVKTLKKLLRNKRSYVSSDHIGPIQPRVPVNPQTDISYYVKNKNGTNRNPDLAQAALLRASLEAIYQRGNINVVHRYGANYSPALPLPFYIGAIRTASDI